ncbi:peptidase M23 [Candidatus Nitromaritima sp. SCGC AAA799-A02]|nr:peptidase M23 [Candidatus Nitromaritima sp. SCGC AAA799-A02]KMP12367.1 peptidase M23 [Candidatus Nitromaritima sp. SCGC AAA799-C22]
MNKDVYTLVIFPGTTGSPKRINISKRWFRAGLLVVLIILVGLAGSSAYLTQRYFQLVGEEAELTELRRESKIRKIQVEKFAQQVKNFESEMSRLERFEKKLRVITALEDSPQSVAKNWGVGGPYGLSSQSLTTSLEREARSLAEKLSSNLGHLTTQAKIQTISFQELDDFFKNQTSLLLATPSIWPTRGWVTSSFGFRKSPFTGLREKHEGWDIAARSGSAIRSTADGIVVVQGREYGYGNMIEVDHGYGLVTRYGHNAKHLVKVGARVKRGQIIATVGNTGRSTGPHLHYEVLLNGVPMNPKNYILED